MGAIKPEKQTTGLQWFIVNLLGAPGEYPKNKYGNFAIAMIIGQFAASALTSALWVYKTYAQEVEDWLAVTEFATSTFFCVWLGLKMLKNEFAFGARQC